jgi:gliding motility-associated-like protein
MIFRQIFPTVLALFASLSVSAQTDTAATDSLTSTGDESKLVMPNTFTPNGDGHNDIFKAKEYRNLSEFHAYIFNRWGQKLYEWTDPAEGWDGTYHGSEVKTGVYFVLVKARGIDDVIYNIRKDVNLLRGDEQRR